MVSSVLWGTFLQWVLRSLLQEVMLTELLKKYPQYNTVPHLGKSFIIIYQHIMVVLASPLLFRWNLINFFIIPATKTAMRPLHRGRRCGRVMGKVSPVLKLSWPISSCRSGYVDAAVLVPVKQLNVASLSSPHMLHVYMFLSGSMHQTGV